jgi:amino acid transporter
MAEDGFLPKAMAWRNRMGAPWVSLIVCAIAWGLCIRLGFLKLLILDTLLYGLSLILEFAALIALRVREPDLARPYKVPGGLAGCIIISLGPIPLMAVAFYQALSDESARRGIITAVILVALGIALYFVAVLLNPRVKELTPDIRPGGFPVMVTEPEQSVE